MPICLLELASKKEDNYNVMKSHNRSCDRFNQIEIISYFNPFRGKSLINYLLLDPPNFFGQSSKSIF